MSSTSRNRDLFIIMPLDSVPLFLLSLAVAPSFVDKPVLIARPDRAHFSDDDGINEITETTIIQYELPHISDYDFGDPVGLAYRLLWHRPHAYVILGSLLFSLRAVGYMSALFPMGSIDLELIRSWNVPPTRLLQHRLAGTTMNFQPDASFGRNPFPDDACINVIAPLALLLWVWPLIGFTAALSITDLVLTISWSMRPAASPHPLYFIFLHYTLTAGTLIELSGTSPM